MATHQLDSDGLFYTCEFDVTTQTSLSCVVNTSNTATIAERNSYVWDSRISSADSTYASFGAAIVTALNAAVADATWSVAFNSSNKIVISRNTTFTIDWTGTSGTRLRTWLGFTANLSGAATYTATNRPYFFNQPSITARTGFSDVYEKQGTEIVTEAESDDGSVYAVSRDTAPMQNDWSQAAETYAQTFMRGAAGVLNDSLDATTAWSWESFFKYVRGEYHFWVYNSYLGPSYTKHRLRAEGASFRPRRMSPDDNTWWIVDFRTREFGRLYLS